MGINSKFEDTVKNKIILEAPDGSIKTGFKNSRDVSTHSSIEKLKKETLINFKKLVDPSNLIKSMLVHDLDFKKAMLLDEA